MQIGLYLHQQFTGVWRVVSEDSDHFLTRLAMIHRLSECGNFDHPTDGEMLALSHQLDTLSKPFEIKLLRGS